jgi:hypothetical protein
MSKVTIPLFSEDISNFSKALRAQLSKAEGVPNHLALMNMLARAAGFQNLQHMQANAAAERRLSQSAPVEDVDHRRVERALRMFDDEGRMTVWPSKRAVQDLCLWVFWAALPRGKVLHEREVNAILERLHLFDDAPILRRTLATQGFLTRNTDGSDYRRVEQQPPPEALALLAALK